MLSKGMLDTSFDGHGSFSSVVVPALPFFLVGFAWE